MKIDGLLEVLVYSGTRHTPIVPPFNSYHAHYVLVCMVDPIRILLYIYWDNSSSIYNMVGHYLCLIKYFKILLYMRECLVQSPFFYYYLDMW